MNNKGTVQRLDTPSKSNSGDMTFQPNYKVMDTVDEGRLVLTNVEVIRCFWGKFWSQSPAQSPSSEEYRTAIEGTITGSYMKGLTQYRNVGQSALIHSEIINSTDPRNGYTNDDVVNMLKDRFDNTNMPPSLPYLFITDFMQ